MTETKYSLDDLLVAFSNYDQQVDVVCCWHGRFEDYVQEGRFEHYPSRTLPDGRTVTPDFLVEFDGYTLVGEICRLPNQPHGFASSVNQARGYLDLGPDVDVMMLVPHTIAAQSEKRMLDEHLLDAEQVLVVSFVRNDGDAKPCWLFAKATQLRQSTFRDAFLGEKSLDATFTRDLSTIRVPLHYCFGQRVKNPFMNDSPPAIYTASYLWQYVFNELLSSDEYLERMLSEGGLEIKGVTAETISTICAASSVKMRGEWIRAAMALLVDAGLASTKDNRTFDISYGKMRARPRGSREFHQLIAERLAKQSVADAGAHDASQLSGQTALAMPAEA